MSDFITGFETKEGQKKYDYNSLGNLPASVTDATNTVISPNADFAEVGEWEDGNAARENRLGYFVAVAEVGDNTIKIRKATSADDVRGVSVYNPAFAGNASRNKYGEDGELLPQYNYIGVMGIVAVIDNGRCVVNGRCMPADDGTAIPSTNNMGYAVLERVDDSRVLIAVEPGADMIQRIKQDIENLENNGGGTGESGEDGRGIVKIVKTGTSGLVDTYTITYTDGTTSTYTVTNGKDGAPGDKGDKGDTGATGPKGDKGDKGDEGAAGKDGTDGFSPEIEVSPSKDGHTVTITNKTGTASFEILDGADGEKGDKGDKGDQGERGEAGKDGATGDKGADGERGHGILKVTTAPTSYTTATGGKNPIKRMALSTIKTQANVDEVLVGDQILHSYYLYNIYYLDASYAYMDAYTSIRGATGAAGKDGYTPVKGTDYYTDADKTEMVEAVKDSMDGIPDYWQTHLDERVEEIRRAMEEAGRNKSSFFFYSDSHWDNDSTYTARLAPAILKYLHKKTPINKTNFGGDIVQGNGSTDTDDMTYLWEWREAVRDLPNHHSVIGNHDDGHSTNDRALSKEYVYSYLLAPEEDPRIVYGGDFYYYIDDPCEKTRYLYLDIMYDNASAAQIAFAKDALISTPAGYNIVAIAHAWFANDYSANPPVLNGFDTLAQNFIDMFDAYNARSGEYASCGGTVRLCIGGHYHLDHYDYTSGGIPVIIVEADTLHDRSGTMPQKGTTDESAVSAVICDYNTQEVKVIRIGRGESFTVEKMVVTNNLFVAAEATSGVRLNSSGTFSDAETDIVTGFIAVAPNTSYTIRCQNKTTVDGACDMGRISEYSAASESAHVVQHRPESGTKYYEYPDSGQVFCFPFTTSATTKFIRANITSGANCDFAITLNEPID